MTLVSIYFDVNILVFFQFSWDFSHLTWVPWGGLNTTPMAHMGSYLLVSVADWRISLLFDDFQKRSKLPRPMITHYGMYVGVNLAVEDNYHIIIWTWTHMKVWNIWNSYQFWQELIYTFKWPVVHFWWMIRQIVESNALPPPDQFPCSDQFPSPDQFPYPDQFPHPNQFPRWATDLTGFYFYFLGQNIQHFSIKILPDKSDPIKARPKKITFFFVKSLLSYGISCSEFYDTFPPHISNLEQCRLPNLWPEPLMETFSF